MGTSKIGPQTGTFCVENYTGFALKAVTITHSTTDYKTTSFGPQDMEAGAVEGNVELSTDGGNVDHWAINFTHPTFGAQSGNEDCGFEGNDVGGKVTVKLNPSEFDIVMPASHSCRGNDYNG